MSRNETHKEKMKRKKMERTNRVTTSTGGMTKDGWGYFDLFDPTLDRVKNFIQISGVYKEPHDEDGCFRISETPKTFVFHCLGSLKSALTKPLGYGGSALELLVHLDNLTKINKPLVDLYSPVWKRECDAINAPYDDLTNFKLVDIEECPNTDGWSIKIRLNGVSQSPITESFSVTKKELSSYFVCTNNPPFLAWCVEAGIAQQIVDVANIRFGGHM